MRGHFKIFRRKGLITLLLGALLCVQARAQWDYYPLGNNHAAITRYTGTNTVVVVPSMIDGMNVTEIDGAFTYRLDIVSVVIPEGVTAIGQLGPATSGAFDECYSLTNVTLPSSLQIIGSLTFHECEGLTNLVIPDGVTGIGGGAFRIAGINSLTLPNSVTTLGNAFQYCYSLTNVVLSTNLTNIVFDTFDNCLALTNLIIPASITELDSAAILNCANLAGIYFEGNSPAISSNNFLRIATNAVAYYIPGTSGWNSFTNLPTAVWWEAAFTYLTNSGSVTITGLIPLCDSLDTVKIPTHIHGIPVTTIGTNAFSGHSNLTNVLLPATITYLAQGAFEHCSNLASIGFLGDAPSLGTGVLADDTNATVYYLPCASGWGSDFAGLPTALGTQFLFDYTTNGGAITITGYSQPCETVDIPSSLNGLPVVEIGTNAFRDRDYVRSVTIPTSVTNIGPGAFQGCLNLTNVLLPNNLRSISHDTFNSCYSLYTLNIPSSIGSIGANVFSNCFNLRKISFPAGVTNIGSGAFEACYDLTNIVLPDNLHSISDYTFDGCDLLTNLSIPAGVTSIGTNAFAGCYYLQNITLPSGLTNIGPYAFYHCASLNGLPFPGTLTRIGEHAFEECGSLTSITIRANTTNIGTAAFAGCIGLSDIGVISLNPTYSSVNGVLFNKSHTILMQFPAGATGVYSIPSSVTNIDDYAFYECRALTNVTIPPGVRNIGTWAFESCFSLTNLSLPSTVTNIGDVAFRNCTNLSAFVVDPANPAYSSVDGVLFSKDLTQLIQYPPARIGDYRVPDSVTTIMDWAFADCLRLHRVIMDRNLTYIGDDAFYFADGLTVIFEGNAPAVGSGLFDAVNGPRHIYYLPNSVGWGAQFSGEPAMLWNPILQSVASNSGTESNAFSFNIVGTSNLAVVVEACTNFADPVWLPVSTNAIINGSLHFSDPDSKSFGSRFYRVRAP
jgi:hypothetical protein